MMLANAGVPMIFWQMPLMMLALLPIVLLELAVARGGVPVSYWRALSGMGLANLASTLVGLPLAWGAMLLVNLVGTGGRAHGLATPLEVFVAVVLQSAWLVPYEGDLNWMIPSATLVLLVPYFLISVWSERFVLVRLWPEVSRPHVRRISWLTNSVSYGAFAAATVVWLTSAALSGV